MSPPEHTRFYLDRENAQWRGVCAGIADYTGLDVVLVRIAVVILTVAFWWPLIAYWVIAHFTPVKPITFSDETPEKAKFWQGVRASPRRTLREVRSRFREIDRRLADVETFVTSSNTRLAREIDQLR